MIQELVKKFKGPFIWATVFSALSSILSISLITLVNEGVNAASEDDLRGLAGIFLLALLGMLAIGFLSQWLLAQLGTSLVYKIRLILLKRVLGVNYENLERIGGHRVLATVTTDVASIAESLSIIPIFAVNFATILGCFTYLGYLSFPLFLVLFTILFLGAGLSTMIMRKGEKCFTELREQEDGLFNTFKTLVDGSKELNINQHRRDFFYKDLATPNLDQVKSAEMSANFFWILNQNWAGSVLFLGLGLLVYIGSLVVKVPHEVLTSFVLFMTYLMGPIGFVMRSFSSVFKGKVAYQKIQSLNLFEHEQVEQRNAAQERLTDWQTLTAKGLCYSYRQEQETPFSIGPIDFSVSQGEVVYIRGSNGSGKSTFAKVLVGLYQAQKGELRLGNKRIDKDNIQWYRNHFSTIFSDFYLFEHILDKHGALVEQAEVQAHLEKLQMADKVSVRDGKLTMTTLSQGQRKRLAMILAYAEDAAIYLFDEWAADQDPYFRDYFYRELLPELKGRGKTVIVISHDDRYFHLADRMYQFDSGTAVLENQEQPQEQFA
ncbi:cyclic peptide export ABC transporter [Thalassomonas actiniarum]|uniref:Cyclic peptide export ABC transporter n=1 Tax=Thalassomonas actiniarum TaxID=485447 RepID=A0AAF0BZU4_9GAMM|nr:cyclic peptide export ABC transporter [Thalassomonas actiniarum]WDD98091.1 cyclic peptide export ABC transporter [Thalassomonas actiniarum]